ncbi:MAG: C1 family peptidase [Paludibacteraceae bacterium]|nr:C1 family peptidase [Paludibacteraceae bacterium]MBP5481746.1 C1 family peptidase [Paludibacteraceae bacterium]
MMKFFRKKIAVLLMSVPTLFMASCTDEEAGQIVDTIINILASMLGYDPNGENWEDTDEELNDGDVTSTSVSWEKYCPPVGNQGQYGTCVAWATSYGLKTTMNMIDGTWNISNKNSASYQCSPVDLWHTMRSSYSSEVSSQCGGSSFDPAFKAMQTKGVATLASVPFNNQKMTCDGVSGKGLSSNKITTYRTVAYSADMSSNGQAYGMTVSNIKAHLEKGPLVIGARLGDRFMSWNSDKVIDFDSKDYQGQHAYHAMMLVGFDDNKKAFRVQNSWGRNDWGDNGMIWVGYNFFVNQFCFGVWGANNSASASSVSTVSAAPRRSTGDDISVKVISDVEQNMDGDRIVKYTITNNGTNAINTKDYSIIYLLFQSRNLSQKHILFNNEKNVVLEAGQSVTVEKQYNIPAAAKAGNYYTALIANPYDEMEDDNQSNNFSYVTGKDLASFYVTGGRLFNNSNGTSIVSSIIDKDHTNAYRNSEVQYSLIRMKKAN